MKIIKLFIVLSLVLSANSMSAQEKEKKSPFSFGTDLVSRYIFRGLDFGNSPAIQPSFNFSKAGFSIGAWGSYAFIATPTGIEADLFASYEFNFGLSVGVTDYYFPGEQLTLDDDNVISPVRNGSYFDYANTHYEELNISQSLGDFTFVGNWGFHNMDNALYFEGGYGFKWVDLFIGGGNKGYTSNGNFNIVNIGVSASKEISISEKYAFGLSSSVILNPEAEQIHLVVALNL